MSRSAPDMSVVLVADAFPTIETTMAHLRAQTVAARLELVAVVPHGRVAPRIRRGRAGAGHRVELPAIEPLARARAAGVRAAAAPVVAFGESHSYPEPAWAEALSAAHEGPWAAVGPAVVNANPGSALAWVNLLLDYGPWLAPVAGGERPDLPGHNSSYPKAALLDFGDRLDALLEVELVLHVELRSRRRASVPGAAPASPT